MILTVKRKEPMQIAEGKTSIMKLCASYGLQCNVTDSNLLVIQDELINPRYDMVLVQSAKDYVEFDIITKEDYAANYVAM
jgi:hypothetical protein